MPEGDTIHHAANRIRPVLAGAVPDRLSAHPRFGRDRWEERLAGRRVEAVEAVGKHLLLRFEGDMAIHSHLRMTGSWAVHASGQRWRRPPHRAWLVLTVDGTDVVQFDGPVLELLTGARTRFDQRLAALGPDMCGPEEAFDERRVLRRLREDDPTRPIGDTLLDQRIVAGMGTVWSSEACWRAGLPPHRPAGEVDDEAVLHALRETRPAMRRSAQTGMQQRERHVYGRDGRPCERCGTPIRRGRLGWDDNRPCYWCPGCQR